MNLEEHAGKGLLAKAGLRVPRGRLVADPDGARAAARDFGTVAVKAQVAAGKRGKAGGIKIAASPDEAAAAAGSILGMTIGGLAVERLLIEEGVEIASEFYAAVLNDPLSKGPLVLFSTAGGMDVEEIAAGQPESMRRHAVDIRKGFDEGDARAMLDDAGLDAAAVDALAPALARLYDAYRANDAELVEVNPLVLTKDGAAVALDCKLTVDDGALARQEGLKDLGVPEPMSDLERRGADLGFRYIELEGDIGLLANGAGLTMTTMDAVRHHGGRPANFLEIGGESYTKATPALELVLSNPGVKGLLVNFCGAFARTDVMVAGVLDALDALKPDLPIAFSVHGTGEKEAVRMIEARLGVTPYPSMDDAVKAIVEATR